MVGADFPRAGAHERAVRGRAPQDRGSRRPGARVLQTHDGHQGRHIQPTPTARLLSPPPGPGPERLPGRRYRDHGVLAGRIGVFGRELRGLLLSAGRGNSGRRPHRHSDHRVRNGHAGPDRKGCPPVGARPRFPGVSRPGRSGSLPAHDRFTRNVRAVPSPRHGATGGKEVGSSLRGLV